MARDKTGQERSEGVDLNILAVDYLLCSCLTQGTVVYKLCEHVFELCSSASSGGAHRGRLWRATSGQAVVGDTALGASI